MPKTILTRRWPLLAFGLLIGATACLEDEPAPQDGSEPAADASAVDAQAAADGGVLDAAPAMEDAGPPAPVEACPSLDPSAGESPIYSHRVQWAHSADGLNFERDDTVLLEHASVPDGVRRRDGETWVYYVNGEPGQHSVFIARLEGERLVPFDCVRLDGEVVGDAVDPDVMQLADGRYRLFYFLGWFTPENRPTPGAPHPFYSAISDDGIHFEVETKVLETEGGGTDPTVVQLPSGRWLMVVTLGDNTVLATSDDGHSFSLTEQLFPKGISELALFEDGTVVRLYLSGLDGMLVWRSDDGGLSWREEANTGLRGADPSLVPDGEGGWTLFLKSIVPGAGPGR